MIWDIPTHDELEAERELLFEAQGGECNWCGKEFSIRYLHIDHITPHERGGSGERSNHQLLCAPCVSSKRNGVVCSALLSTMAHRW